MDKKCLTDEILNISLPGQQLFYGFFCCNSKTQKTTDNKSSCDIKPLVLMFHQIMSFLHRQGFTC